MSERLTMRKIRETLRLHEECGRSQREIASSLSTAVGTICGYLQRTKAAGLTWALVQGMTDSEVEALLFRDSGRNQAARRAAIDYAHVHHELHKSTATLEPLWSGYQEGVAARGGDLKPYQYSQFCELYGAWRMSPSASEQSPEKHGRDSLSSSPSRTSSPGPPAPCVTIDCKPYTGDV